MYNYVFSTKTEAREVLTNLKLLVENYLFATVADLKELVDDQAKFTDERWGWGHTKIKKAKILETSAGYLLLLPMPKRL